MEFENVGVYWFVVWWGKGGAWGSMRLRGKGLHRTGPGLVVASRPSAVEGGIASGAVT